MGQQVGDDKLGVARLTADNHIHHFPALQGHNAVELQGDGDPLVLLDAAVVMGLEKAHLVRLIHGDLFQVQPGRVHMGAGDHAALRQAFFADNGQHQGLAPVVAVDLHAGFQLHAGHIGHKALALSDGNGVCHGLPLGAGAVQIVHIRPGVVLHRDALLGADQVIAVLLLVKKLASQIFHQSITSKNLLLHFSLNSSSVELFFKM